MDGSYSVEKDEQEELPVSGGSWNLLTVRRQGGLKRIFLVLSGTSQNLPSLVLCAAFKTAMMTAICCGKPNLSCSSSLSISQYNHCHSTGLP